MKPGWCVPPDVYGDLARETPLPSEYKQRGLGTEIIFRAVCYEYADSGYGSGYFKACVARILAGLPERPWLKPILQIHDELTFIIPEDRRSEAVTFVKKCMEAQPFPEFDLPLLAEASAGTAYGSMEELDD